MWWRLSLSLSLRVVSAHHHSPAAGGPRLTVASTVITHEVERPITATATATALTLWARRAWPRELPRSTVCPYEHGQHQITVIHCIYDVSLQKGIELKLNEYPAQPGKVSRSYLPKSIFSSSSCTGGKACVFLNRYRLPCASIFTRWTLTLSMRKGKTLSEHPTSRRKSEEK